MTLKDVDLYLKRKALAEHPNTPAAEAENARKQMMDMELEHEDIARRAAVIVVALNGTEEFFPRGGPAAGPKSGNPIAAFVDGVFQGAARAFGDTVAGEVTGERRQEALNPQQVVYHRHACGKGQVCFEVRVRAADMKKRVLRDQVLDKVEALLREG